MRHHLNRFYRDERGMSFVFVGLGFMAFLVSTTLAIDVGMFMTARSQAQNAADAGALAGATALVFDSYTDHSAGGPAVQSAITGAQANQVIASTVSVKTTDVTFLNDPAGNLDRVKVDVYRTGARSNPLPTLVGQLFGVTTVDVIATATAEAAPADSATCVLPFTIPDKWTENSDGAGKADGPWAPDSTYDLWYAKGSNQNGGVALPNPDHYTPPGQTGYTGFDPVADYGTEMVLKSNNQNKISPSIYNPFDIDLAVGANNYENNIANCNSTVINLNQWLLPETGNMSGPTKQGVDALIAEDPDAVWDPTCGTKGCVMRDGVKVLNSRRIGLIPLYNPDIYANGQQSGKSQPQLQVVNLLGFFVEGVNSSGDVTGRIYPVVALKSGGGSGPAGTFAKVIRLVQ
jgi:Flp pilus assembly protein TadG